MAKQSHRLSAFLSTSPCATRVFEKSCNRRRLYGHLHHLRRQRPWPRPLLAAAIVAAAASISTIVPSSIGTAPGTRLARLSLGVTHQDGVEAPFRVDGTHSTNSRGHPQTRFVAKSGGSNTMVSMLFHTPAFGWFWDGDRTARQCCTQQLADHRQCPKFPYCAAAMVVSAPVRPLTGSTARRVGGRKPS